MLVIYWKSGPSKGYSDLYPSNWFEAEGAWPSRQHQVKGPKGGLYPARCSVVVEGKIADLDYAGEHGAHNERWHFLGTLRIVFSDASRSLVEQVLWRDDAPDAEFQIDEVDAYHLAVPLEGLDSFDPTDINDGRKKIERMVVLRQGQADFRRKLMTAYDGRCAVTGCAIPEVLEAAHISPFLGEQTNHVNNGLLLRADIHTLFDRGLIKVDRNHFVTASPAVAKAYDLPEKISLPSDKKAHPHPEALELKFSLTPL